MSQTVRVVIPVVEPNTSFFRCLEALLVEARGLHAEVVIVLNHESERLFQELREQLGTLAVSVRRSAGIRSAAAARNLGAVDFSSGTLVFVDSDVVIEKAALERLVQPILSGSASAAVGNYGLDISGLSFLQSYKQLYVSVVYSRRVGEIRNEFWTALGAVDAAVFHALGGSTSEYSSRVERTPSWGTGCRSGGTQSSQSLRLAHSTYTDSLFVLSSRMIFERR